MIRAILNVAKVLIIIFWISLTFGSNYALWLSELLLGEKILVSIFINGLALLLLCVPIPFIIKGIEECQEELSPKKPKSNKKKQLTQEDLFLNKYH